MKINRLDGRERQRHLRFAKNPTGFSPASLKKHPELRALGRNPGFDACAGMVFDEIRKGPIVNAISSIVDLAGFVSKDPARFGGLMNEQHAAELAAFFKKRPGHLKIFVETLGKKLGRLVAFMSDSSLKSFIFSMGPNHIYALSFGARNNPDSFAKGLRGKEYIFASALNTSQKARAFGYGLGNSWDEFYNNLGDRSEFIRGVDANLTALEEGARAGRQAEYMPRKLPLV